jgi:hypothetical protein
MTNGRHQPSKPPADRDDRQPNWTRTFPATRRGPRRTLLVAAAVGLCAIATGASLAAFSSPGGQAGHPATAGAGTGSSAGTGRSSLPTPPVPSSSTGPNATSAGIAKTAMQYPPKLQGQILRWTEGSGGAAWSAVTAQLGSLSQVAGAGLYSQLRMECASFASSVQTARSAPPIPDKVMQRSYAKVLAQLGVTSADCRDAISVHPVSDEDQRITVNKVLLNRSLAQFVTETKALYAATAEIRTVHR